MGWEPLINFRMDPWLFYRVRDCVKLTHLPRPFFVVHYSISLSWLLKRGRESNISLGYPSQKWIEMEKFVASWFCLSKGTFHYFMCLLFSDWCVFMLIFMPREKSLLPSSNSFVSFYFIFFIFVCFLFTEITTPYAALKWFKPLQTDRKLNFFCFLKWAGDREREWRQKKRDTAKTLRYNSPEIPNVWLFSCVYLSIRSEWSERYIFAETYYVNWYTIS